MAQHTTNALPVFAEQNGHGDAAGGNEKKVASFKVKAGLAQMLKPGVIMVTYLPIALFSYRSVYLKGVSLYPFTPHCERSANASRFTLRTQSEKAPKWNAQLPASFSTNSHTSLQDVVTPEQARIAEEAGAVAVMALERVPADIRKIGGVARMSDPEMIKRIQAEVSIPVMAKVRIGHFVEAQVRLQVNWIFPD